MTKSWQGVRNQGKLPYNIQCDAIRWGQFSGDVVSDSFKMVYIDKDSDYDQKYEKRIFLDLYYEDLNI